MIEKCLKASRDCAEFLSKETEVVIAPLFSVSSDLGIFSYNMQPPEFSFPGWKEASLNPEQTLSLLLRKQKS